MKIDNKSMEQKCNPEVNPQIYGKLIFDMNTKGIQWGKESFQHTCSDNWIAT